MMMPFFKKVKQNIIFLQCICISYQFYNNLNQKMDEPHMAKPKIAKNASSKLPEAFRMQSISTKKATEPLVEQIKTNPLTQAIQQSKETNRQIQKKQKKSKNPFLPIKEFIRKYEQFSKQMKDVNVDFDLDRLAKYSFDNENKEKGKIKYENCITLSVIRKNMTGCLKKVLHVPTLTVHFLRQSLISANEQKSELNEWISIVNRQTNSTCIRILQVFWNMPEDYYSLLYEYSEGLLLDSLNESLNTLPLSVLQDVASLHFNSGIGIFTSELILNEENGMKVIKYLPMYEESDIVTGQIKKIKDIIESQIGASDQNNAVKAQRKLGWKIGLILLNGFLGSVILSQDVEKIILPLKKCCLFHEILSNPNSLSSIFLNVNLLQDQSLIDFLCKCLRSKRSMQKEQKIDLKSLKNHKFLTKKYPQIISLFELISIVDPSLNITKSQFEINKMNKILDSIGLILQNTNISVKTITAESKGVIWLAKQLGMAKQIDRIILQLKKVYKI